MTKLGLPLWLCELKYLCSQHQIHASSGESQLSNELQSPVLSNPIHIMDANNKFRFKCPKKKELIQFGYKQERVDNLVFH